MEGLYLRKFLNLLYDRPMKNDARHKETRRPGSKNMNKVYQAGAQAESAQDKPSLDQESPESNKRRERIRSANADLTKHIADQNKLPEKAKPILTRLSPKREKNLWIVAGVFLLAITLIFAIVLWVKGPPKEPSTTQALIESSQTTVASDRYAFIYATTVQTTISNINAQGELNEAAPFSPEEVVKAEKFFGQLPESPKKASFRHNKVKGIYVYDPNQLDTYLKAVKDTEVNSFVIDAKESWGLLYDSQVPLAKEVNSVIEKRDLKAIYQACHAAGIRVIARIVCFKDTTLAEKRPDLCISSQDGRPILFPLENNSSFASPYNPAVWQYLIDIAKEVIELGADEIQFDYVRFPSGGSSDGSAAYHGPVDEVPEKASAINRFLQTAAIEIQDKLNIPVGADLFSIVMTSEVDGLAIGQNWSRIGLTGIDNICPMIYPSHYANASLAAQGNGVGSYIGNGFYEAPDLEPYKVVKDAFVDGLPAIKQEGYAHIRPYLQAFTASYLPAGFYKPYGGHEIREQIRASQEAGFDEWILWNPNAEYPEGTFLKDVKN